MIDTSNSSDILAQQEFVSTVLRAGEKSKELSSICTKENKEKYIYLFDTLQDYKMCDDSIEKSSYLSYIIKNYGEIIENDNILETLSKQAENYLEDELSEDVSLAIEELETATISTLMEVYKKRRNELVKKTQKIQYTQDMHETTDAGKKKKIRNKLAFWKAFASESEQ